MITVWTPGRLSELKELAATMEYSASQIAAILGGGLTRCAVIGKAKREGIPLRAHNSIQLAARPRAPRAPRRKPIAQVIRGIEEIDLPPDQSFYACTLVELEAGMCRYPLGDPQDKSFRFCGTPDCEGSYCERHHAIAYWNKPHPNTGRARPDFSRMLRRRHLSTKEALQRPLGDPARPDEVLA
jgi:GcrA cell cycle regulator